MIFAAKNETMRLFSKKSYTCVKRRINCTEQSAICVKKCTLLSAISYLICIFAPIKNNMDALLIDNP